MELSRCLTVRSPHLTGGGFYVANQAAWESNSPYKMAAVIVKGGRILSIGNNHLCGHPEAYYGSSFHAEHDAIRKAGTSLQGAKMYVYRFGRSNGELRVSKPCLGCQREIANAGISAVLFVNANGEIEKESFKSRGIQTKHFRHKFFGSTLCYVGERV